MPKVSELISKEQASVQGKPDANLANDANHLGGIEADEYATKAYVQKYHTTKETAQKEYIDSQDQKILEEAKEYANSQVRNQDFSSFAKITDVNSLKTNLEEKIAEGDNTQKNYTDTKIKQVVNDANANFEDVSDGMNTLNGRVDDLFQNVSNGKGLVAEAITDKGVPTSANDTFSTMAGNIRDIKTGGSGEVDPNYINTSDANAEAGDIKLGKTAYVKGNKVYGTLIAQEGAGQPTYGLDTSDATAYASDIANGKTAYARGQKIIGTMTSNEVQEIYGLKANTLNISDHRRYFDKDPITGETYTFGSIAYSKDLRYCVCITLKDGIRYIESYPINEHGVYVVGSISIGGEETIKKYRYTKSELGIPDEETIVSLAIGAGGVDGSSNKCYLYIITQKLVDNLYTYYIYVKTYHLRENGVIGKEYENENVIDFKQKLIEDTRSQGYTIIPCNLDVSRFFLKRSYYSTNSYQIPFLSRFAQRHT